MNEGRIIDDSINIDDLCNQYKRNIYDLISLLQFKIAVFDFDGTLTDFNYDIDKILPCKEEDLEDYSREHNIYEKARILKTMQYVISQLDPEYVFIITNSVSTIKDNKNKCILGNFPYMKKENIIHTTSAYDKLRNLRLLHEKYNKQIIFVEDMAPNIQVAEENLDFVKGYHISSLLA